MRGGIPSWRLSSLNSALPLDHHDRLGEGGQILGKVGVAALADGRAAADLDHEHQSPCPLPAVSLDGMEPRTRARSFPNPQRMLRPAPPGLGGAFHQVVERGHNDDAVGVGIAFEADVTPVGAGGAGSG